MVASTLFDSFNTKHCDQNNEKIYFHRHSVGHIQEESALATKYSASLNAVQTHLQILSATLAETADALKSVRAQREGDEPFPTGLPEWEQNLRQVLEQVRLYQHTLWTEIQLWETDWNCPECWPRSVQAQRNPLPVRGMRYSATAAAGYEWRPCRTCGGTGHVDEGA